MSVETRKVPVGRIHAIRAIQVLSLVATLGFIGFCLQLIFDSRTDAERQAFKADSSLAQAISQDLSRNFELYDLYLQGVLQGLHEPALAHVSRAVRQLALFDRTAEARFFNHMLVLNKDGDVTDDSRDTPFAKMNLADRDYFRIHQTTPDYGLYVSKPIQSQLSNNERILVVSRRISGENGEFQGIVLGTLNLDYFQALFANLDSGEDDTFGIVHTNGTMIMRHPFQMREIGRDIGKSPLFKAFPEHQRGVFKSDSLVDGVYRNFTFTRVPNLPLIVVVGSSRAQVLAAWFRKAASMAAMMVLLLGAMATLGVLLARELRRRHHAEQQSAELAKKLAIAAATDSLTELPNRRHFEEIAAKEWKRAARNQKPLSILILDVDHFKRFNDRYGHLHGDVALREVAALMRKSLRRPADLGARYGGEEFAILLPVTDLNGARVVAEKIRATVEQTNLLAPSGGITGVTVSIGIVSIVPSVDDDFARAFAAADEALYRAKSRGRNCVEAADLGPRALAKTEPVAALD